MKKRGFFRLSVVLFLWLCAAGSLRAESERGLYLRSGNGDPFPAIATGTTVEVRVTGIVARARVTQIFTNPTPGWVEGIYLFPLPDGAAVDALRMTVGDRTLDGSVRAKQQARTEYVRAKQEGRRASLLELERPGVFTTAVANIGPGETIEITIELQQVVEYGHGRFGLRFPLALPPRYAPTPQDALPIPKPVAGPAAPSFAFHVDLAPGFPLGRIESASHKITVAPDERRLRYAVDLADGVAPADSDFLLEWAPVIGRTPRAVYFTEEVDGERYALLMVMPPDAPDAAAARLPRETVFVIDTSGSMQGESLQQARQALLLGLGRLGPGDAFNVIRFSSQASALFPSSVPADPAYVELAKEWVRQLEVDGGTEMLFALDLALSRQARSTGLLRQVIFATDGQVSNEAQLLGFIRGNVGASRLFTVAIGSAPNAAFLRKAADLGRGSFTAIAATDQVTAGMDDLFARIESPLLRDLTVRWSDPGADAWPERIPDLYLGEPIVVTARLREAGAVEVEGLRESEAWRDELPAPAEVRGAGLDKLWAGRKIQALLDGLTAGADRQEVEREVTALGLRHGLLTPYTSFIVAEEEPSRPAAVAPVTYRIPGAVPRGIVPPPVYDPSLDPNATADLITVTAESPLLDERTITTGTMVSQTEIELGAGQGDVWAALRATPGVLTDRINAGGTESGWQPAAVSLGSGYAGGSWAIDSVKITDLAALGSSPSFYDFDAFEEMQVTTGGADTAVATPGPQLNLIGLRGTNEWRASGRLAWTGGALAGEGEERLEDLRVGSGEVGGPFRRDRAWFWGELTRSEIERTALGGDAETRTRDSAGTKLNFQLTPANSLTLLGRRGDASGEDIGAAPSRSRETLWAQDGREVIWKAEDTHILSSNFYLTGTLTGNDGSLQSRPGAGPGGGSGAEGRIDAAGVARGSWFALDEDQRSREAGLSASSFFSTGSISHELQLSAQDRSRKAERLLGAPDRLILAGEPLGLPAGTALAEIWEAGRVDAELKARALWLQDTLSAGRATFTLGLRWDTQDLGTSVAYEAETLAPRLGMTYGFGPARTTLLRATLARYAAPYGTEIALAAQPGSLRGASYLVQDGEPSVLAFATGPWALARDLAPEITDEASLELEHALRPELVIGLRGTWRRTSDVLEERWLVRDATSGAAFTATADDWIPAGTVDGVAWYDLRPGLEWTGRRQLANGDRRRDVLDLAAFWNKRFSNRWMSRGHVAWHDWTWQIDPQALRYDDPTPALGGGDRDGQRLLLPAGGSILPHAPARFLGSRWSFHLMGTVELPRSFFLSLAADGSEGVPLTWYRQVLREETGLVRVPVPGPAARTSDLLTVDFLAAQEVKIDHDLHLTLTLDVFNLLDAGTIAERELDLGAGRATEATRVLAPRTFRVGGRVSWR